MSNTLTHLVCSCSIRYFKEMLETFSLFLFIKKFYLATCAFFQSMNFFIGKKRVKVDMTLLLKLDTASNLLP